MTVEDKWTYKETIFTLFLIISILTVSYIVVYYTMVLPDQQMIQKWKDDIAKQNQQRINEQKIIDSQTCIELKNSISNNQFQLAEQYAQQHYIGKCT